MIKKVVTVKGKYDVYEKDESKVKSSKLEFNTPEDIEAYEEKLVALGRRNILKEEDGNTFKIK